MMNGKRKPLFAALKIYLICYTFRAIECFIPRIDQTIFGEAFVHKLAGIFIFFAGIKLFGFRAKETGLDKDRTIQYIAKGPASGAVTFIFAHSAEVLTLALQGKFTGPALYVSAYAVDGNIGHQAAPVFLAFCMTGNIINAAMEESIFWGLFPRLLEQRYTCIILAVIVSSLLDLWHIMTPTRSHCDSTMSLEGLIVNSVMLAVTTCLIGFKLAMITKSTGNLYMTMGDHFFNNTIVNISHVISITDADELMILRISIARLISFIAVLLWCFVV